MQLIFAAALVAAATFVLPVWPWMRNWRIAMGLSSVLVFLALAVVWVAIHP